MISRTIIGSSHSLQFGGALARPWWYAIPQNLRTTITGPPGACFARTSKERHVTSAPVILPCQ
ncbi:hypothetical protein C8Q70DRAFT_1036404 [Cubamyces menziesii]|nr:hypothetical protein C8Q70DRAFT_1036404 [Cubamyces menziesii]